MNTKGTNDPNVNNPRSKNLSLSFIVVKYKLIIKINNIKVQFMFAQRTLNQGFRISAQLIHRCSGLVAVCDSQSTMFV